MNDNEISYEKSLEDSIERLNNRIAKLSYIIQPHFIIFERDGGAYAIQLYVNFKGGTDPFQEWSTFKGDGDHDEQDDIAKFSIKFQYDKINKDIIAHAEINKNGDWECKLFTGNVIKKNFNYKDNVVPQIKQMLLEETGLSGFVTTESKTVYVDKEKQLKDIIGDESKWLMEKGLGSSQIGTPAGGFSQYTIPVIKSWFERLNPP